MKNTKKIIILSLVIYSLSNASENKTIEADTIATDAIPFEELTPQFIDEEHNGSKVPLEYLFGDCYRYNKVKGCQELLAFAAYKIIADKNELRAIISSQEQTITTQRDTLKVYNELNERRHARIRKRKEDREQALLNK